MNQLRPEDRMQRMQPCDVVSGTLGFSCFLVSFPLRFSSFSCPNFGTSQSQSFASPSSYTSLALSHPTFLYQQTAFHQSQTSDATPPLLRLCQGNLFLCFHKFHCLKSIPRTQSDRKFQCQGVNHRSIALFCSSLFLTISSKSPENNGKHHDQK